VGINIQKEDIGFGDNISGSAASKNMIFASSLPRTNTVMFIVEKKLKKRYTACFPPV
jgi:hypothetical protein